MSALIKGASFRNTGTIAQLVFKHNHLLFRPPMVHLRVFIYLKVTSDIRTSEVVNIQPTVALVVPYITVWSTAVAICGRYVVFDLCLLY